MTTNAEEIRAYAPEVIVLIPCGYYKEDILRQLPSAKLPEGWNDLPAVKDKRCGRLMRLPISAGPVRAWLMALRSSRGFCTRRFSARRMIRKP